MKAESRSILLFIDNCSAHPDITRSNIKLVFLPPSASEVAKKVNILDAIMWLKSAWDEVQPARIQKCFAKCSFSEQLLQCDENEEVEENDDLQDFVAELGMTWDEYCNF